MNSEYVKDLSKAIVKQNLGNKSELDPGSVGRRYEPTVGTRKHNERIHRESRYMDHHGNLPFTFSKPKKPGRSKLYTCGNCGVYVSATVNTISIVCRSCGEYAKVVEVPDADE